MPPLFFCRARGPPGEKILVTEHEEGNGTAIVRRAGEGVCWSRQWQERHVRKAGDAVCWLSLQKALA